MGEAESPREDVELAKDVEMGIILSPVTYRNLHIVLQELKQELASPVYMAFSTFNQ